LDIAGRLGMDPGILKQAANIVHQQDRQLDHVFSDLQAMHHRLRQELEDAEIHRHTAESAAAEIQERVDRLRTTEREELRKVKKKFKEELARARTEIRQTLDTLKQDKSLVKAKEAKQRVSDIERELIRNTQDDSLVIPLDSLQAGDLVEVSHLGTSGTLLENPQGKKRVRLQVGNSELSVAVELLIGRSQRGDVSATHVSSKRKMAKGFDEQNRTSPSPSGLLTLDLRGQTVEEALECLALRLDEAALTVAQSLHVIHGHGTGKLKIATRRYLSHSPYVESYRPGIQGEGGDGVTIVELR